MFRKVVIIAIFTIVMLGLNMAVTNNSLEAQSSDVVVLRGEITSNMTLKPNKRYLIEGGLFVRKGATLKIKAGTQIFASTRALLVIDRGAKIMAKGKVNKPIVFTSAQDPGNRKRGDWGGIIINGFAPINNGDVNGEADGEGNTGKYGGKDPDDNSGIMQFVRIEFAGFPLSPTNELNGLALQGVGRGTVIENIQITESGDDAIEIFGGTVNVKRLLIVGSMDDGLDWTGGWQGKAQFVIIQQDGAIEANNGIEADNNDQNNDLEPRSKPTIFNITIIGDANTKTGSSIGMLLRVGTAARIANFVAQNYKDVGVRVKDQATLGQLNSGQLTLEGGIFFDNKKGVAQFQNNDGSSAGDLTGVLFKNVMFDDPRLTDALNKNLPNFRPQAGSMALNPSLVVAPPAGDTFFENVNFVGGMGGGEQDDWTKGWTSFRRN